MLEWIKEIYAKITGGVYESPAPLTGIISENITYKGDMPSDFKTEGEPGFLRSSPFDRMKIRLEGNAADKVHMTGALQEVSTGGGNDTVTLASNTEVLLLSRVCLGGGNDVIIPTIPTNAKVEQNFAHGGEGTDTILLQPDKGYVLIQGNLGTTTREGVFVPDSFTIKSTGTEFSQFEQLRFEAEGAGSKKDVRTFALKDILEPLLDSESYGVRFDPKSGKLSVSYTSNGESRTMRLTSLEEQDATSKIKLEEADKIEPPLSGGQAPACKGRGCR